MMEQKMELPKNCEKLDYEEMRDVIGGSCSIPMDARYMNKDFCLQVGSFLLGLGAVKNMSQISIAQEIYAHACAYYSSNSLKKLGIDNSVVNYLVKHSKTIELEDGGDTMPRQIAYAAIWTAMVRG